jgi:hypothetical protein
MSESKHEGKEDEGKGADSKDDGALSDEELVSKVQEFFYANEALANIFESYVKAHAHIVDLEAIERGDEYKLEYTEAFHEYTGLFEKHMEDFIVNELGVPLPRFYSTLKRKTDEDVNSSEAIFGQILLAVTEFDVFMTMMREEARAAAVRK